MICSAFPPPHFMLKNFGSWLIDNMQDKNPFMEAAKYAMERLQNTVYLGGRKLVPSLGELGYIKERANLPVLLTFVDGYQLEVEVTPSTIVKDVFEAAVNNIGLKNCIGSAIYECLGEQGIKNFNKCLILF